MKACRLLLAFATTLWGSVAVGQYNYAPTNPYGPPPGHAGVMPVGGHYMGGYGPVSSDAVSVPDCGPAGCGTSACSNGACYSGGGHYDAGWCPESAIDCGMGCGPKWGARAGWIAMKRVPSENSIVRFNGAAGGQFFDVINERDYDFEPGHGVDASIWFNIDGCTQVEGRYMWFDDSSDTIARPQNVGGFPNVQIATGPVTTFTVPAGTLVSSEYRSGIDSGEINVRNTTCGRFTFIGGFRYVNLDESVSVGFNNAAGPVARFQTETDNDMFGVQLGTEFALAPLNDRFSVDLLFKGGVYYNDVRTTTTEAGIATAATRTISSGDDTVAFVGETGLYATYWFNDHWAVRGGMQAMWLHGVATAGEQVGATGNLGAGAPPLTARPESEGNTIFYGANVSIITEF